MKGSPEISAESIEKKRFTSAQKEQVAIKYLIDTNVEEERLVRWQKLLPRINQLKQGGKQEERRLVNEVRKGVEDSLRHKILPMLIQKPIRPYLECKDKCEIKDINLDLQRTFPSQIGSKKLQQRMKVVLNAIAYAIPEVGYCQGMNFIVGTLLLRVDDQSAFNVSYHIFHWEKHQQLLTNLSLIHQKLFALSKLIRKHYPQLSKHMKQYDVDPIIYASSWFITIFCNCLPTSYALRILECMLLQGQKVVYRVALQILKIKKRLLKSMEKVQSIVEELKNYDELLESKIDEFFDSMYLIKMSREEINDYKMEYRQKKKVKGQV